MNGIASPEPSVSRHGLSSDDFRKHGHALVDLLADWMEQVKVSDVNPATTQGEIIARMPRQPPQEGEDFSAVMGEMFELVRDNHQARQAPLIGLTRLALAVSQLLCVLPVDKHA